MHLIYNLHRGRINRTGDEAPANPGEALDFWLKQPIDKSCAAVNLFNKSDFCCTSCWLWTYPMPIGLPANLFEVDWAPLLCLMSIGFAVNKFSNVLCHVVRNPIFVANIKRIHHKPFLPQLGFAVNTNLALIIQCVCVSALSPEWCNFLLALYSKRSESPILNWTRTSDERVKTLIQPCRAAHQWSVRLARQLHTKTSTQSRLFSLQSGQGWCGTARGSIGTAFESHQFLRSRPKVTAPYQEEVPCKSTRLT